MLRIMSVTLPTTALVDQYVRHLSDDLHRAPRTVDAYREELQLLLKHQVPLEPEALAAFVSYGESGQALAPATRNRRLAVIRGFCRFLIKERKLRKDPTAELKRSRVPKATKLAHSADDFRQVLSLLRQEPRTWRRVRNETILFVLFYTGLRVFELVGLDVGQVDLQHGFLWQVRRKGGGSADVLLEGPVREMLATWLSERPPSAEPALFLSTPGRRLGVRQIEKMLKQFGEQAGLIIPLHPHAVRHDHGTLLHDAGGSMKLVQASLGHTSLSTTERYVHPGAEQQRAALRRLPDLNAPPESEGKATISASPAGSTQRSSSGG